MHLIFLTKMSPIETTISMNHSWFIPEQSDLDIESYFSSPNFLVKALSLLCRQSSAYKSGVKMTQEWLCVQTFLPCFRLFNASKPWLSSFDIMRGRKLGLCLADLSHDIMSFYLPVKYTHATILSSLLQKSNKDWGWETVSWDKL